MSSQDRARARTEALTRALARGLTPREAAEEVGLSIRTVMARLEDPEVLALATAGRPACGLCRGAGACDCKRACSARSAERARDRGRVREGFVFHDGRTCHICLGSGRSPIRWNDGSKRERASPKLAKTRRVVVAEWIAANGPVCPGWGRPLHDVDPGDLTADHRVALASGGHVSSPDNLAVLCRSCNSRKSSFNGDPMDSRTAEETAAARLVGSTLRNLRESAGLDLEAVRLATGRSVSSLSGVEDGAIVLRRQDYRAEWFRRWMQALGVPSDYVLRRFEQELGIPYLAERRKSVAERATRLTTDARNAGPDLAAVYADVVPGVANLRKRALGADHEDLDEIVAGLWAREKRVSEVKEQLAKTQRMAEDALVLTTSGSTIDELLATVSGLIPPDSGIRLVSPEWVRANLGIDGQEAKIVAHRILAWEIRRAYEPDE